MLSHGPHHRSPTNPEVTRDRRHRVGVLADPPAGLGAGPLGQHRPIFELVAWFEKATFERNAGFDGAAFQGVATFSAATFEGGASFGAATFEDDAVFDGATFVGDAVFDGATFAGGSGVQGVAGAQVLHLDDPDLNKRRMWPHGYIARPDPADRTRSILVQRGEGGKHTPAALPPDPTGR